MASRLQNLIHIDQVGFLQGWEARDGTMSVIDLLFENYKEKGESCLKSTDVEKPFDRVNLAFMLQTLRNIGVGERIMKWIFGLYLIPSAQIRANGTLSNKFQIKNRTRQGCPLSPLLFIVSLKPFLRIVRKNRDIKGIRVGTLNINSQHMLMTYCFTQETRG